MECAKSSDNTENKKNEDKLAEDLSALKVKDEKDSKEGETKPKENGNTEPSEKEPDSTTETPKPTTETPGETTSTKDWSCLSFKNQLLHYNFQRCNRIAFFCNKVLASATDWFLLGKCSSFEFYQQDKFCLNCIIFLKHCWMCFFFIICTKNCCPFTVDMVCLYLFSLVQYDVIFALTNEKHKFDKDQIQLMVRSDFHWFNMI